MNYLKIIFLWGGMFICAASEAGFWSTMWGAAPQSSVIFAPVGYHFMDLVSGKPQPNNLNFLTAVNYKSFIVGTFNNSEKRQVYFAGINRNFYQYKKFSLGYLLGIMHGYNGFLESSLGPVLGHDPGPLVALSLRYTLNHHFDLFSAFEGYGFLVGGSYRF